MEFRILGPLEVVDDGRLISLGPRQRELLSVLLLRANKVVSPDRLSEALWPNEPFGDRVKGRLHRQITELRRVVGHGRLETRPQGYLLRVEPPELDLRRF